MSNVPCFWQAEKIEMREQSFPSCSYMCLQAAHDHLWLSFAESQGFLLLNSFGIHFFFLFFLFFLPTLCQHSPSLTYRLERISCYFIFLEIYALFKGGNICIYIL